jgi:pyruvate dehydrogenase E2 component (dihydrolipoamide acetyltransferase)
MSNVTLRMPRLGETMDEGTVNDWLVPEGAEFVRGAPLIEFETDKTAVEFPALGTGRLIKTYVSQGDVVKLGDPIAEIDLMGAEDWVSAAQEEDAPEKASDAAPMPTADENSVLVDLLMPRLGETMEEGKIMGWMVDVGAQYVRGTSLLEVETDKTVAEFPALVAGCLVETFAQHGDVVKVGTPIARIKMARDDVSDLDPMPSSAPKVEVPSIGEAAETPVPTHMCGLNTSPVRATPVARSAARKAGLMVNTLRGTGRRGRIELADVTDALTGADRALAHQIWGDASGSSVMMVHGFAGDISTLEQLGKSLARGGCAVRAVDLPSHGQTVQSAQSFDDLVDVMCAELDPARPVHLIGHSLGAAAAVVAAAKVGGVSSLTLIAPAGLGLHIDADFVSGMANAQSAGAVGHLLRRLSARASGFSDQVIAEIHADLSRGRLLPLAHDICKGGQQTVNVRTDLARLAAELPVQILTGMRDEIVNWQDALDVSPHIALHVFATAGHMPHWDMPADVASIIKKWVKNE